MELSGWRWAKRAAKLNVARLLMMVPGFGFLVFSAIWYAPMTEHEFRTAVGGAVVLMVGGYIAPAVKKFGAGKDGITLETHDRSDLEESREAALELTEEVQTSGASVLVDETVSAARFFAGNVAIGALLEPAREGRVLFHLYVMDNEVGGLVPVFEGEDSALSDQPAWLPGIGAVGKAYVAGEFVVAVGPEASDGTHGLSKDQQQQHAGTGAVAATPVLNANGTVLAVLSASEPSATVESCSLATMDDRELMSVIADGCARILVDLLGWYADDV